MLTPQEIAAGATGVGDLSFANPPQQGGVFATSESTNGST